MQVDTITNMVAFIEVRQSERVHANVDPIRIPFTKPKKQPGKLIAEMAIKSLPEIYIFR
jgi:hypothetical protein